MKKTIIAIALTLFMIMPTCLLTYEFKFQHEVVPVESDTIITNNTDKSLYLNEGFYHGGRANDLAI